MSVRISTAGILDEVAWRMETNFDSTSYFTLARAQQAVVDSGIDLSALLHRSSDVLTKESLVATIAGFNQLYISTEVNLHGVKKVQWIYDFDKEPIDLTFQSLDDYYDPINGPDWQPGSTQPRWRMFGDTINVYPTPQSVWQIRILYTGQLQLEVGPDSDFTIMAYPGWQEWLVNDVCRKMSERENRPRAREFERQRDAVFQNIIKANEPRQAAGPRVVRDVAGYNSSRRGFRWR